jgi:signal transduction histidine kinase
MPGQDRSSVTTVKATEVELRLLLELTEAISGADDHAHALASVLGRIGAAAGWHAGAAWIGPEVALLECAARWTAAGTTVDDLVEVSAGALARETTMTAAPAWATFDGALPHAVGFPIASGPRTLGAVVFFSARPIEVDGAWIAVSSVVTAQLGMSLARKQADDAVRERTRMLEHMNRELEEFAAVASHDLQEPLRKIRTFASRLRALLAPNLDDTTTDYFRRMDDAASRMQQLMEDLLAYAQLARAVSPRPVDLAQITREVLRDLETAIEQAGARIEVGELPALIGVPLQLRQLMQNLIANALKFARPGVPPVVHIEGTRTGDRVTIAVGDNGIGFDEKHLARIFAMLQRLHGRGAYPGSGMGLAICRRVVEAHGGEITARSTPNEGSTFLVTLPLMKALRP